MSLGIGITNFAKNFARTLYPHAPNTNLSGKLEIVYNITYNVSLKQPLDSKQIVCVYVATAIGDGPPAFCKQEEPLFLFRGRNWYGS